MDIKYEDRFGIIRLDGGVRNAGSADRAARRAYAQGYRKMDAYTPLPVEGLAKALGVRSNAYVEADRHRADCRAHRRLLSGVVDFGDRLPDNVGGRPLNSWPAYIPITFECTVLLASLTAVFGMLALNGFPQPYHPVFNVPRFQLASVGSIFLVHRGARSEVRAGQDEGVSGRAGSA